MLNPYGKAREEISALRGELHALRAEVHAQDKRITALETKHEHVYDPAREWKRDAARTVIAALIVAGSIGGFKLVAWALEQMK